MRKVCGLLKPGYVPVQVPHVPMQDWIIVSDHTEITLHVLHIHGIKADKTWVYENITLCKFAAEKKWPTRIVQVFLELVQCSKCHDNILIIASLRWIEPGFIHTGDEMCIEPRIQCIDVGLEMVRTQRYGGKLRG